ncbi:MAG: HAMP domain-containing protein [Magnetospirillum gryphiswaldense]|nr:HAMP domain-containing protein [Magnetospirillum gryphiswaldense]
MRIPLWSRLGLAPRIAVVIVFSLVSLKAADEAMPLVIRPPEIMFFQHDWLIDSLRDILDRAVAVSGAERQARLQDMPARRWLDVATQSGRLDFGNATRRSHLGELFHDDSKRMGAFDELRLQIASRLGLPAEDIVLMANELDEPERSVRSLVIILPELPMVMRDVFDERRRHLLSSDLRIGIRIGPQEWLVVTPRSDGNEGMRMVRNIVLPLCAVITIALFSIWVARGIVKPLDDLAAAAEKLGRDRELSLVGEFDAPELRAIGNSFNAMQQRLKRFVDDRLQMIAAISHDLRTPLTRLRLFAEFVPDPDQRRQVLSDINDMEKMVSATLTFASNKLKDEPRSPVDLAAMLISLCDTATDSGSTVSYDGPDHAALSGKPVALRRAFANLIDNGCKFGNRVQVRLCETPSAITVTVADDGPGIPADQRDEAFRPFARLETSRNRQTGGTGLGLTITQDVVLAHHGTIALSDSPGGGLLVTLTVSKDVLDSAPPLNNTLGS